MSKRFINLALMSLLMPMQAFAAEATTVSPTGSVLKMVLGLVAVLAVMAIMSWVVKRMLPNQGAQHSAIKMVGGVNVGTREKVVVLEVSGRWLVVGVAQGQVSAIANLESGSDQLGDAMQTQQQTISATDEDSTQMNPLIKPVVKPFSAWLQKSVQTIKAKQS